MTWVATRSPLPTSFFTILKCQCGAGGDLGGVGDGENLRLDRQAREALADRVGDRAADPGVDLVENQRRRGAALGEGNLEREEKAREFAARGDLHQRPRPRAGIGLHAELHSVVAVGRNQAVVARDFGAEARALQFQRRQFGVHRALQFARGALARVRQRRRGLGVSRGRRARLRLRARRPVARLRSSPPIRRRIFAPSAARPSTGVAYLRAMPRSANKRSSHRSSSRGSKSQATSALSTACVADLERFHRLVQRQDARLDQRGRLRHAPLQTARDRREHRQDRRVAGQVLMRLADVGGDFFALHHARPPFGQRFLLARLHVEPRQFFMSVPREVGLGLRGGDARALGGQFGLDFAQRRESGARRLRQRLDVRHRRRPARDASRRPAARARRAGRESPPGRRRRREASAR